MGPSLNKFLKLVPFPETDFRNRILFVLAADIGCSFFWDRFMMLLFAPKVLKASLATFTPKSVFMLIRTFMLVSAGMYWLCSQDFDEIEAELERQELQFENEIIPSPLPVPVGPPINNGGIFGGISANASATA